MTVTDKLTAPPLALYAHMPWCVRKCPYCDFNSHVAPESIPQEQYIAHLLDDLDHDLPNVLGRPIETIFFGGGTPSLFSPSTIKSFLDGVRTRIPVAADVEVTLEANPGTIERGRFAGYREAGVNRVSLGVQSFSDHQLKLLGRIHQSQHVIEAVEELRAAGFENFNLDLMYGLPRQTLEECILDITRAIDLQPTHLSHYQLTLEPGTVFFHKPPPLPDEDSIWEMQLACQATLAAAGYEQYEVSAYARAGRRCAHNLNYWQFGDYLGLGAGAHGKWSDVRNHRIVRTERIKQPREYLSQALAPARLVRIDPVRTEELPFEFALNALRLNAGFSREQFESRTGLAMTEMESALRMAEDKGLLQEDAEVWKATDLGRRFLTDLQGLFLPDQAG